MSFSLPLVSGHTGYAGQTALDLIARHQQQVEDVARFRPTVRDFRAPRMELSSSLDAVPLKDMRPGGVDYLA